jgi:antibiotic biosynthesis monooxygenase (ABM) superfamily enzyme
LGADHDPVTVVITRSIRQSCEAAFEEAVRAWIRTALTFPGYLGVHMLRPPPGGREYGAVLKFCSRAAWDEFSASAAYQAFLAGIGDYLEEHARVETVTGLESWFTPAGSPVALAPPRWKMALVTWIGVNLTTLALSYVMPPVTVGWPWWLAFVTFNAGVVVGLTWAVMPALARLFRPWLEPRGITGSRRT